VGLGTEAPPHARGGKGCRLSRSDTTQAREDGSAGKNRPAFLAAIVAATGALWAVAVCLRAVPVTLDHAFLL
jgi:hypothetical protein